LSTRTIIEINHDCLHYLLENPDHVTRFLQSLKGSLPNALMLNGIKVLGQRHHSETLKLTVK
jgi:hypothetical protein